MGHATYALLSSCCISISGYYIFVSFFVDEVALPLIVEQPPYFPTADDVAVTIRGYPAKRALSAMRKHGG